jgi:cytoskeleton protein RodZ
MKSVGKQLQEARLAKNWTPELAARETKIKVERVRDLEADDYSQFSSPTYARGFVRTYARALSLDEYKILRQLDNKLPEDDNASFVTENGLPYVPESSQSNHVSSSSRTGLYIVLALGGAVTLIISFVLLQAYRAGELPRYFATSSGSDTTNSPAASVPVADEAPPHALPVDPNDTTHSVRALPVDPNSLPISPVVAATNANVTVPPASTNTPPIVASATNAAPVVTPDTNAAPVVTTVTPLPTAPTDEPMHALRALPVDPASLTNAAPPVSSTAPATTSPGLAPAPETASSSAPPTSSAPPVTPMDTKVPPRALPVDPSELAANTPETTTTVASNTLGNSQNDSIPTAAPGAAPDSHARGLVLAASKDSFVRVVALDSPQGNQVLYASVLRGGQSLSFTGRKFSVDVGVPSAMDVTFDGVNYDSHGDGNTPETLTLESHLP